MTTEQLQNLGRLLTSGEDNALLARELMIGQGIWNVQGVCDILNVIADRVDWLSAYKFITANWGALAVTQWDENNPIRPMTEHERSAEIARIKEIDSRYRPIMGRYQSPTLPTTPEQTSAGAPSGIC